MTVIIAVSGWRGFTAAHPSYPDVVTKLGFWAGLLSPQALPYWRVGDEEEGFDKTAHILFETYPMDFCQYFANWNLPNKAGGPVRSSNMLKGTSQHDRFQGRLADYLLAFPQPGKRVPKHEEVSGTWRAVELAYQFKIPVILPGVLGAEPEGLF